MERPSILNINLISVLEARDVARLRNLSLRERGELLSAACRTAATIEASRQAMGLPPSQPAPWPESTWEFLREAARRARARSSPDA